MPRTPVTHAQAYKLLAIWSFREPTAAESQELFWYIAQQEARGTDDSLQSEHASREGEPPVRVVPPLALLDQRTPRFASELPPTVPGGVRLRGGCHACGGCHVTFTELTLYLPGNRLPNGAVFEYPVYYGGTSSAEQTVLASDVFVLKTR